MAIILPDGFGLASVKIRRASGVDYAINTWGYDDQGETADENADTILLAYESLIMDELTEGWVLESCTTIQRDGATYTRGFDSANQPGGLAVASDPPQVAYLVKKMSAAAGRQGRGRVYLPGVAELQTDGSGGVTAARLTGLQTALNGVMAAVPLGYFVLLHRNPADPSDYNFAAPTPVTQLVIDPFVATQRRRLR